MSATYQIAEVAERSGFTPATLRYYEDIGLLHPAGRTEAGYRLYDDDSLRRLRFIARAKQLGCSLDEIAELSPAWDGGQCAPVQERLRALVEAKAAGARRQIAELMALTADLQRAAAGLSESPTGACDDTCGCLTDEAPPSGSPQSISLQSAARAAGTPSTGDSCAEGGCGCGGGRGGSGRRGEVPEDDPPIACTLDADQMGNRVQEWEALLAPRRDTGAGVVARAAVEGGVRLQFGSGTDVTEIARLAAAEHDCCRFFRFDLSIDTHGVALEVRAPDDARDLVTTVFGAAP